MPRLIRKQSILFLAVLIVAIGWLWFAISPSHWLEAVDLGKVTIDGRLVPAEVYFGRPTFSEAETIALVHVTQGGDFLLDFGSERVRESKRSEYVHLPHGVWFHRPMQSGVFVEPLPFQNINEFRLRTHDGHILSVQF